MTVNIVEVITRSTQGTTRPFLCRGDDGRLYYVKGNFAGRKALCAEWIAGHLGKRLGLPIPPFVQVSVSEEMIRYSAREDLDDLGAGISFGSQKIDHTDELRYPFVEQLDQRLRAKILLFDWWVCNPDRTLSPDGGNPNILWVARDSTAHVIDHNLAFEPDEMSGFWSEHIFRGDVSEWNASFRNEMAAIFKRAMTELPQLWRELPEKWTEVATGITLDGARSLLSRFESEPHIFWSTQ